MKEILSIIIFFTLLFFLLILNIHKGSQIPQDDVIYAEIAREAIEGREYLNFRWQGNLIFEKPPVLIWILSASIKIFGENEFSLRFPVVLCGFLFLILLFLILKKFSFSMRSRILTIIFVFSFETFYLNARRPITDILMLCFSLISMALIWDEKNSLIRIILSSIFAGLGFLTKGVALTPFFILIVSGIFIFNGFNKRSVKTASLFFILSIFIGSSWHIYQIALYGNEFLKTYFGFHLFERIATPIAQPPSSFFYFNILFKEEGVSGIIAIVSTIFSIIFFIKRRGKKEIFIILSIILTLIPLQITQTKLPHYLTLILFPFALCFCAFIDSLPQTKLLNFIIFFSLILGFLLNCYVHAINPDYSRGVKKFCEEFKSEKTEDLLLSAFEIHDPSITWYCKKDMKIYGKDRKFLEILKSIPMFKNKEIVEFIDENIIRELSLKYRKIYFLTSPHREVYIYELLLNSKLQFYRKVYSKNRVVFRIGREI